jgi:hypothetical protein
MALYGLYLLSDNKKGHLLSIPGDVLGISESKAVCTAINTQQLCTINHL